MQDIILEVSHASKLYGKCPALDDVSIQVKRGEIYGLVGNNGAGKTTLMRLITGQSQMDEGKISLWGETEEKKLHRKRKRIGALVEEPGLFADLTARENLEYFRLQFGIPGKTAVDQILETVGLAGSEKKKFRDFSVGMKQRLGIGVAILNTPELLILDEPINGLDPLGIIEIRNTLLELNQKKNTTIVISSHILSELSNLATCYGFLSKGKLLEQITAEALQKKCNVYLELQVDHPKKMAVVLEKDLHIQAFKVYPDHRIHIYEQMEREEEIGKAAILNDVGLHAIHRQTMNLEQYYMKMIGGQGE